MSSRLPTTTVVAAAFGFAAGFGAASLLWRWFGSGKSNSNTQEDAGDDAYNSLFYSLATEEDGKGMPETRTVDPVTMNLLRSVHQDYRFLPKDFYGKAVENLVITCVDVVVQRKSDKKILLFSRRDAPAKGIWWWPGGRMFRGVTFADTAVRKVKDETGGAYSCRPRGLVGCWNTFFPDSNSDAGRQEGKTGTQTMNAVVVCECDEAQQQQSTGEVAAWAVEAQRWVTISEALAPLAYDKYVRLNVSRALKLGLLQR